jgi:hypothetical protein
MKDVVVNYGVSDNCGTSATSLSVTSNEAVNGNGDGNTSPDWEVVNNHLVRLRAERSGNGMGRIYTITIRANDACNNVSTKTLQVVVNHDNSLTVISPGAKETEQKEGLDVLDVNVNPNPSSGDFRLSVKSADDKTAVVLRVYNGAGQVVETIRVNPSKVIVFGSGLKAGVYMVEATQGPNRKMVKLVKL